MTSADGIDHLHFEVTDTGGGIPEDDQLRIFESFAQGKGATARGERGTGLGLSISRTLVECMGGKIGVESIPNHGSTFWFSIPLSVPVESGGDAARSVRVARVDLLTTRTGQKLNGLRILVCEDNVLNQRVIARMFELLGQRVTVCETGEDAIALHRERPFHIIFFDIQLPGISGLDAAREIRSFERRGQKNAMIVAMTAHSRDEFRASAKAAGMDDYLTKPMHLHDLCNVLNRIIASHQSWEGDSLPLRNLDEFEPAKNASRARQMTGLAASLQLDVAAADELLALLRKDGAERHGKMVIACQEENWSALMREAHSLKGAALNLNLRDISEICENIERICLESVGVGEIKSQLELLSKVLASLR